MELLSTQSQEYVEAYKELASSILDRANTDDAEIHNIPGDESTWLVLDDIGASLFAWDGEIHDIPYKEIFIEKDSALTLAKKIFAYYKVK